MEILGWSKVRTIIHYAMNILFKDLHVNTFVLAPMVALVSIVSLWYIYPSDQVRDPTIEPEKKTYTPGSTVSCVAKGNPEPKVKVTLPDGEVIRGKGAVKVVIADEWESFTKSIHCEASNEVDGVPATKSLNYTFSVASKYCRQSLLWSIVQNTLLATFRMEYLIMKVSQNVMTRM